MQIAGLSQDLRDADKHEESRGALERLHPHLSLLHSSIHINVRVVGHAAHGLKVHVNY